MRAPRQATASFLLRRAAAVLVIAVAAEASAKECGDQAGGSRIACACGDTVVTSTTLTRDDPVVRSRCMTDGLIVKARPLDETLVLDLAGLSIVGSGVGSGIAVLEGGSEGAVIRGGTNGRRGQVVGFGTGIRIPRGRTTRRIEALEIEGNRFDGLTLISAGTFVVNVDASRNGGDGLRVGGVGGRLLAVSAVDNRRSGLRVSSRYTVVDARSERNREHGLVVRGSKIDLAGTIASDNDGFGIVMSGYGHTTERIVTERNGRGGLAVTQKRGNR